MDELELGSPPYFCKACKYNAKNNKYNMKKHLRTAKCIRNRALAKDDTVSPLPNLCNYCEKIFSDKHSLSRHKNKYCKVLKLQMEIDNKNKILEKEKLDHDNTKNQLINHLQENNKILIEKQGNITNNININFFLENKCKDALNIDEFIQSLVFKLDDLEYTKNNGICAGISKVIISQLRELGKYKRPLHCTDLKKETLYIKNNDEWQKSKFSSESIKQSINSIADKQRKSISLWTDAYPNFLEDSKQTEEFTSLVSKIHEDSKKNTTQEKIIKNISKDINIFNS